MRGEGLLVLGGTRKLNKNLLKSSVRPRVSNGLAVLTETCRERGLKIRDWRGLGCTLVLVNGKTLCSAEVDASTIDNSVQKNQRKKRTLPQKKEKIEKVVPRRGGTWHGWIKIRPPAFCVRQGK